MIKFDRVKLRRCLSIAAEISELLVMVKDKPRIVDIIAISTKSMDIGSRILTELSVKKKVSIWEYFFPGGEITKHSIWAVLPLPFEKYIIDFATDKRQIQKSFENGEDEASYVGNFHGHEVGWVSKKEALVAILVKKADRESIYKLMHDNFWAAYENSNVVLNKNGFNQDELDLTKIVETDFIRNIRTYISKVLEAKEFSSLILSGKPGTGKTLAIQAVIADLGLKSIRIPLKTFTKDNWNDPVFDFKTVLKVTQPDILIIDDMDRLEYYVQKDLLEFIDTSRDKIKFIIASANNKESIISPLRRPGRFDQIMEVPPLEQSVLDQMLKDSELTEDMLEWPMAYVEFYQKFTRIFGRNEAIAIIPSLQERVESNGSKRWEYD